MVKKYFKLRGRPPVLMEEEEYEMMIKKVEEPKTKSKKVKESKDDGN
jgi:hypothetical protein